MANKKIYICVTQFFPTPDSWRGAYVLDQVKAIQRHSDYEVLVFLPGEPDGEYEIDGVTVHTYRHIQMPSNILLGMADTLNGWLFKRQIKRMGIKLQDIAVVHCHTVHYASCGLSLKAEAPHIKVMLQHHDLDPFNIRNGMWAHKRWNVRYRARSASKLINAVDCNICISTPVLDNLLAFPNPRPAEVYQSYLERLNMVSNLPTVHPKSTYVLYNGVDTSLFKPAGGLKKNNEIFRIGCIANFQELKDHMTLIKAFELLHNEGFNDMRLSLLGTGETKDACVAYMKERDLMKYVEWPKEVTHDKLPEYYQSLDLFVLPSIFEGLGCVYLEAAACDIPYIGVYGQGASECVQSVELEKWMIVPHDYRGLAVLIRNVYKNSQKQNLCMNINIDCLIKEFIKYIEKYESNKNN